MQRNMPSRALLANVRIDFIINKILWVIIYRRNCGTLKVDPHSR